MNRREFVQLAGMLPLAGMLSPEAFAASKQEKSNRKIVVLVELRGGNDGLNTLVPFADENYKKHRPRLHIRPQQMVKLNEQYGMHNAMTRLKKYWDAGDMALIQGVGYPGSTLSHFDSIERWECALSTRKHDPIGWVSQTFGKGGQKIRGISLDAENLGPFAGVGFNGIRMNDPEDFLEHAAYVEQRRIHGNNPALRHVLQTENEVKAAEAELGERFRRTKDFKQAFPKDDAFYPQLASVARMIHSGLTVPAYKVSLEGFDTHSAQANKHSMVLRRLASGLSKFAELMEAHGHWDNVLVMTYSEFGRRVQENSAIGTDHGNASSHLVMGGAVKGKKVYGDYPDLANLVNGDLKHTVDLRSVYRTIAHNWWGKIQNPWTKHQNLGFV